MTLRPTFLDYLRESEPGFFDWPMLEAHRLLDEMERIGTASTFRELVQTYFKAQQRDEYWSSQLTDFCDGWKEGKLFRAWSVRRRRSNVERLIKKSDRWNRTEWDCRDQGDDLLQDAWLSHLRRVTGGTSRRDGDWSILEGRYYDQKARKMDLRRFRKDLPELAKGYFSDSELAIRVQEEFVRARTTKSSFLGNDRPHQKKAFHELWVEVIRNREQRNEVVYDQGFQKSWSARETKAADRISGLEKAKNAIETKAANERNDLQRKHERTESSFLERIESDATTEALERESTTTQLRRRVKALETELAEVRHSWRQEQDQEMTRILSLIELRDPPTNP